MGILPCVGCSDLLFAPHCLTEVELCSWGVYVEIYYCLFLAQKLFFGRKMQLFLYCGTAHIKIEFCFICSVGNMQQLTTEHHLAEVNWGAFKVLFD